MIHYNDLSECEQQLFFFEMDSVPDRNTIIKNNFVLMY